MFILGKRRLVVKKLLKIKQRHNNLNSTLAELANLLLMPVSFFTVHCVLWLNDTSYSKCLKKWIGSTLLETWRYNFQPPTLTLIITMHSVTDRQTDRREYDANSQSYCVQYDQLKSEIKLPTRTSFNKTSGSGMSFGTFLFPRGRSSNHETTASRPSSSNVEKQTSFTLRLLVVPTRNSFTVSSTSPRFGLSSEHSLEVVGTLTQCLLVVSVNMTSSSHTMLRDSPSSMPSSGTTMYLGSESMQLVAGLALQNSHNHHRQLYMQRVRGLIY